jgi:glycolate oxidase iron-sulfur subunit
MSIPESELSFSGLLQEAARCVSCGLCVPHCPTYRKTLNEADSPRGRIALMAALLEGRLPPGERLVAHLDACLTCRACEAVCPNHVAYGRMIETARAHIEQSRRRGAWQGAVRKILMDGVVASRSGLALAGRLMRAWQGSGLRGSMRSSGILRRLGLAQSEARLPAVGPARAWREAYPAAGPARGEVGLFLGCVARLFDGETLEAAIFVLNRLGYTVRVPPTQGCCGALHLSQGDPGKAAALARKNITAFDGLGLDAVVFAATGCGSAMKEYPATVGPEGSGLAERAADISAFLALAGGWEDAAVSPLEETVAVHEPCSMRNVLRCQQAAYQALGRIPGLKVLPLAGNDQCCGGAGAYSLTQPEMAAALLHDKIEAVRASGARILVTSNIGCALHLAGGIKDAGLDVEVVHPATLLARQMGYRSGDRSV